MLNLNPEQFGFTTAWWLRWTWDDKVKGLVLCNSRIALNEQLLSGPTFECVPTMALSDGILMSTSIQKIAGAGDDYNRGWKRFHDVSRVLPAGIALKNESTAIVNSVLESSLRATTFRVTIHAGSHIRHQREEILQTDNQKKHRQVAQTQWKTLHATQHPFDVCFIFTDSKEVLWENKIHLGEYSPYWRSLMQAGFAECHDTKTSEECKTTYIHLNIDKTAGRNTFAAYQGILGWTRTNLIDFGPLQTTSNEGAKEAIANQAEDVEPATLEVDPLTVYEICKYIQLDELAALALVDLSNKLTVDNVLHQLFSTTLAWKHQDLRHVLLRFYSDRRHRHDTKLLQQLHDIRSKLEEDELAIPVGIAASLMTDLAIYYHKA